MININLLPPEIKLKIIQSKRTANVLGICLVVIIAVGALGIILSQVKSSLLEPELNTIKGQINQSTSQLESFSDLQEKAFFLNDRAKLAENLENQKADWSLILQELINSVPIDVQFETLNSDIEKTPNFVLQGNTVNEREIIKFKEKLENSDYFKDVAFKSSTKSEEGDKLQFSLEFNLEKKNVKEQSNSSNSSENLLEKEVK